MYFRCAHALMAYPRVLMSAATGSGKTQEVGVRLHDVIYFDKVSRRPPASSSAAQARRGTRPGQM